MSKGRRMFSVPSANFLKHSNQVFELIALFISGIRMLITALTKLCSEEFFPFFIICSGTNMPSVNGKFRVKSFGKKCQALRDREKVLFKKDIAEKYGVPRNTVSTCIKNKSKYFLHWNNHRIK